jgi:alpha-tubulin suppressor-like RCC1 family protein
VAAPSEILAIAAGERHSCAVVSGEVWCWGDNQFQQLGRSDVAATRNPVRVEGLSEAASAVVAGDSHTCATTGIRTMCWGYNWYGELGNDSKATAPAAVPAPVSDGPIAAGRYFSCAVAGGTVQCWGRNLENELGVSLGAEGRSTPDVVPGLAGGAEAVAAGAYHACAIVAGGALPCWGDGGPPVQVFNSGATATSVGRSHECAIDDGLVWCWGDNAFGQVSGLRDVPRGDATAIAAGRNHACAIIDGNVWCWGDNSHGQLGGTGTTVEVITDGSATLIAAGAEHSCAVSSAGLQCWGDNTFGQLGAVSVELLSTVTFQ